MHNSDAGTYFSNDKTAKSLELFYPLKVVRKTVADNDKVDIYGHTIQNGSENIESYYLEKAKETKGKVFYKHLNKFYLTTLLSKNGTFNQKI